MTTTTRYVNPDGQPTLPGNYRIIDTSVRVVAVTRPDGFTVAHQHTVITHTLAPDNPAIPAIAETAAGPEQQDEAAGTAKVSAEQALAAIKAAFDACFTPDFNGVDWRDDKAIQTLAATVYPILSHAAPTPTAAPTDAQETRG